ncbi:hypothetical protein A3F06_02850 [candidate division TM6 bacterium RIFCSPHIGHO2_12_FULL_36_22]|nr:MAG: hypothetical protein A3F06_02850 [candidate division TM6 bacterium RIFCSPHIGHO2_12_FULL_36_22]
MKKLLILSLGLLMAVGGTQAYTMPNVSVPSTDQVAQSIKNGYKKITTTVTGYMPSKKTIAQTWVAEKVSGYLLPSTETLTNVAMTTYSAATSAGNVIVDSAKQHPYYYIVGGSMIAGMLTYAAYKKATDFSDLEKIDLGLNF